MAFGLSWTRTLAFLALAAWESTTPVIMLANMVLRPRRRSQALFERAQLSVPVHTLRSLESGREFLGKFTIHVRQKDAFGEVRVGFAFKKCRDAASSVRGEFPSGYLQVMVSGAVSGWFLWARVALEYN